MDGDFLEAVKRHILSRLQMRGRPNITHAVPKAAMVTALRKLHAGKVREDGRVEIPHLDGHASPGADGQERISEIISFAETGGWARGLPAVDFSPSCTRFSCLLRPPQPARPPGPGLRAGPLAPSPVRSVSAAVFLTTSQQTPFCSPYSRRGKLCPPPLLSRIRPERLWARVPLPADACGPCSAGTCLVIA